MHKTKCKSSTVQLIIHCWCNNRAFCSNMFTQYVSVRHEKQWRCTQPWVATDYQRQRVLFNVNTHKNKHRVYCCPCTIPQIQTAGCTIVVFCQSSFFLNQVSIRTLDSSLLTRLGLLFSSCKGECLFIMLWFHSLLKQHRSLWRKKGKEGGTEMNKTEQEEK